MLKRFRKRIEIGLLSVIGIFLFSWCYLSINDYYVWSVSIYQGSSLFNLKPHSKIKMHPVLSAADVTDVKARTIADPFMIWDHDRWFMFFEVKPKYSAGKIGLATSEDGISWKYEKIVLDESFHLSYPYVFRWKDKYYLLPESAEAGAIRLYSASEFPYKWKHESNLLTGKYGDPSICFKDDKFWLFALNDRNELVLFFADSLAGPWMAHPKNPLIKNDLNIARPGGRLLQLDGKLIRFTQDCDPDYGNSVRAFQIDRLSTSEYEEHELSDKPLLAATGSGWNKDGMHHIDPHNISDNGWIACVDGKRYEKEFNLIKGLKKIKSHIRSLLHISRS